MKKVLFILIVFCNIVFASNSSKFSEIRYVNALDKTFTLSGNISFSENDIKIEYLHPQPRIITYQDELLIIKENNSTKTVEINSQPVMGYFFMIIRAIYDDNYILLDSFFDIEEVELGHTKLIPKDLSAQYLEDIVFYKDERNLKLLKIVTTSQDRIEIEVFD